MEIRKIKITKTLLIVILLTAFFLRFYKLSTIPDGFFDDESAIGYNAYSILKTGRDEWGQFLPLYFKSTGEYKLPGYIYLTIPFILIFGLNEFAIRFLSALAGFFTILVTFFLARHLAIKIFKSKKADLVGIISALFLTFEPWHVHFSRIALEANLSLFFVILGFYLLLSTKKIKSKKSIFGFFLLSLSFFTYLASRIFVPLLSIFLLIIYKNKKEERKKWLVNLFIFLSLFLSLFLNAESLSRAKGISILHPFVKEGIEGRICEKIEEHQKFNPFLRLIHNKPIEYGQRVLKQYLNHFSPDFLFFKGDQFNKRFSIPFMGNLLLFELPFFLAGLYFLLSKKHYFMPLWLISAPVPSALSFQSPSSVRSIFILPAFQIIAAVGIIYLFEKFSKKSYLRKLFVFSFGPLLIINIIYFLDNYFVHQLIHKPYNWDYDFKKMALQAKELESDYDEIIIGKEGATCSHILFFRKVDPSNIWKRIERRKLDVFGFEPPERFGKYYFNPKCPIDDSSRKNILYICKKYVNEEKFNIIDKMYYKDKTLNFVFFENKNEK